MTRPDATAATPLPVGKLPAPLLGRLIATYLTAGGDVLVGPGLGRDAAVLAFGDRLLVAKTDPITFATRGAADYLIDVNANDLACLGARPRWLLATALFPEGVTVAAVEEQFAELAAAAARRGIAVVGGHSEVTAGLDRTVLVAMLLGEVAPDRLLRPGGARPGDRLLLTKGIALEGTALLARELEATLLPLVGRDVVERAKRLLVSPGISVMAEAETALDLGGVTALHDPTEGGLATAVREVAAGSGCGAVLRREAIPVLPETAAIAAALGLDPIGMLASGSLLIAARPPAASALRRDLARSGIPVAEVGVVVPPEKGFRLEERPGRVVELPRFDTDEVSRALIAAAHPSPAVP